jgi:hypothetical protein
MTAPDATPDLVARLRTVRATLAAASTDGAPLLAAAADALVCALETGATDVTTVTAIAALVPSFERLSNRYPSTENTPMPSIPFKPERDDAQNHAREAVIRAKFTAAILYLDLALETVSDGRVRTPIAAASRAVWAAADLLDGVPTRLAGRGR